MTSFGASLAAGAVTAVLAPAPLARAVTRTGVGRGLHLVDGWVLTEADLRALRAA